MNATRLSRFGRLQRAISHVFGLARRSLPWLTIMTTVTSCIVANPPEYTDPTQTPPQLNVYLANPPLNQVLIVKSGQIVHFNVPVRSEDAGEDLTAIFFLDYGSVSPPVTINQQTIPASTYGATDRAVKTDWTVALGKDPSCHVLSLLIAHRSSFLLTNSTELNSTTAVADASFVQWWVNANAPDDAQTTLVDCPTPRVPGSP